MSPLQITIVDTIEGLERLRGPWNELIADVDHANPYQCPEFVIPWFRQRVEPSSAIHVATIRRSGRLVGVAPFEVRQGWAARLGARRLRSAACENDYCDPLLADGVPGLADALLDHLARVLKRPGASVHLYGLREDGALLPALKRRKDLLAVPYGRPQRAAVVRFDIVDDPVTYVRRIAKKRDALRSLRRLREQHDVTDIVEVEVEEGLDLLTTLLGERWPEGKGPHEFRTPDRRRFTRTFVKSMAAEGRASIKATYADGRPVWVALLLRVNDRVIGQTLAIGQEFRAYGPGIIGLYQTLEEIAENGDVEKDMLSGDWPYKKQWANDERTLQSFWVVPSSPAGRLQIWAAARRRSLGRLRRKVRVRTRLEDLAGRKAS